MRIYIAGKYSADNVIDVLKNIREGIKISAKIIKMGHSPFCPWLDHQFSFYEDISVEEYYKYSLDFLEVCEAMLVLPDYQKSKGTLNEIKFAEQKGIPIYYNIEDIK